MSQLTCPLQPSPPPECLSIDVARNLKSEDVLKRLSDLFVRRGVPKYIRSDNGPEFTANKVRDWLGRVEVQTLFIEPVQIVVENCRRLAVEKCGDGWWQESVLAPPHWAWG